MKPNAWVWRAGTDHTLTLLNKDTRLELSGVAPEVKIAGTRWAPDASWAFSLVGDLATWQLSGQLRLELRLDAHHNAPGLRLTLTVTNLGKSAVALDSVTVFQTTRLKSVQPLTRAVVNGKDMIGTPHLRVLESGKPAEFASHAVLGLSDAEGSQALVAGFLDLSDAFYTLDGNLCAVCDREGTPLEAGASLTVSPLSVESGSSLSLLMDNYATASGRAMNARQAKSVSGWCSWYYYYDTLTNADLWQNVHSLTKLPMRDHLEVIQIDDGWNLAAKGTPRLWGDWEAGGLFPEGMKAAADGIKAKGFIPGLWLAPFSVDPTSQLYADHPDWLVQDLGSDKPADYWGVSALDLTHPEALAFVRRTFERVFNQWGFEYIKIDFLCQAVFPGRRHDRTVTTARAFRNALQIVRDVALDRYILGCGSPMGPAVGIVDAMRLGFDISSRWDIRTPGSTEPWTNLSVRGGFIAPMWRNWMQGRWWQNDADCLLVRDFGTEPEKDNFALHIPAVQHSPPYGLSLEEASAWAQFLWFTGGLVMIGENVATLNRERLNLLQTCFPLNPRGSRWVDWYEDPWVFVLRSDDGKSVAVFNLTEKPLALNLPSSRVGLEGQWTLQERLSGERISGSGNQALFPVQPAHSGRVYRRD